MYWLLIGEYTIDVVEADDFDDLQRRADSDYYDTVIRLSEDKLKKLKEQIDEIVT